MKKKKKKASAGTTLTVCQIHVINIYDRVIWLVESGYPEPAVLYSFAVLMLYCKVNGV